MTATRMLQGRYRVVFPAFLSNNQLSSFLIPEEEKVPASSIFLCQVVNQPIYEEIISPKKKWGPLAIVMKP